MEKEAKRDKDGAKKVEVAKKVLAGLDEGHRARTLGLDEDEQAAIYDLHLLTMKPMLYIANVDEDQLDADLPEIDGCRPVPISAKVEADLAELDPAEAKEYLEAMGLEESGLARWCARRINFWGCSRTSPPANRKRALGPSPSVRRLRRRRASSTPISSAASSRRRRLVRRLRGAGRREGCRDAGKLRQEGKEYVVQDGDVMHFKFNV